MRQEHGSCLAWRARLLLGLIFAIQASSSPVFAQVWAWHTAQPLTPNASVDQQGSFLSSLDLRCVKSLGDCSWSITTNVRIFNGTSTLYGIWLRDPAGNATTVSVSQTSIVGSPYNQLHILQENANNGFVSVIEAGPPAALGASPNSIFLHSFVLTKSGSDLTGVTSLRAGTPNGFTGFEPSDPFDFLRRASVDFNPAIQLPGGFEWANPVINITNVPEPATAAMLLAPAVLLRRRRSRCRTLRQ